MLECDPGLVRNYAELVEASAHKRRYPATLPRADVVGSSRSTSESPGRPPAFESSDSLVQLQETLSGFIHSSVQEAEADGVVVNLSGGVDSSVTASLAVEALGADRVYGLILPCGKATEPSTFDATDVADRLEIPYSRIDLHPLFTRIQDALPDDLTDGAEFRVQGNLVSRLRMGCAYYIANTLSRLVVGTTNGTEWLLGYFTKYGDGGVDLLPLGDLYKTQVRQLADRLGIRSRIIEKQPTAGLWEGQDDEDELGATYDVLDAVLHHAIDNGRSVEETARLVGVEEAVVQRFVGLSKATVHKRTMPPTPSEYDN